MCHLCEEGHWCDRHYSYSLVLVEEDDGFEEKCAENALLGRVEFKSPFKDAP